MLKGISPIMSPELLKVLMEMGHSDEIVLADANFPAVSHANLLVRSDGHSITELLHAILPLFPLDQYVETPLVLMDIVPGDAIGSSAPVWQEYEAIAKQYEEHAVQFEKMERFAFYERAKKAYAIVATGEQSLYGNLILKKGVIK